MPTAYTSLLGLALPVTGELSGTWGDTVNNAITSLLDTAIAGTTTLSTDADVTLTTTTGASNQARQAILLCNGARTAARNITAPATSKTYVVINSTTGGFGVVIRGAGPTTGVTIANGERAVVAWNGSDFVKISGFGGTLTVTDLTVTGNTILGDAAGDTITVNGATTFTNVNPTLSAGTANGVLYLNGSKVATSGSALTFDGTNTLQLFATGNSVINLEGSATNNGILRFRNGTTGNLSGLYGTNAKDLVFEANGAVEQMRLTSTGLGVTQGNAPTQALNLYRSGSTAVYMAAGNSNTSLNGTYFGVDTAGNGIINQTQALALIFSTNNTERMRLDSSGNLGIGTSSPGQRLEIQAPAGASQNATIRLRATDSGSGAGSVADIAAIGTGSQLSALAFSTRDGVNVVERMRLDSSGNLGLGVTPSAWSGLPANGVLQMYGGSLYTPPTGGQDSIGLVSNAHYNGTNWIYKATSNATRYEQYAGIHRWFNAPSGTAGNTISFTQAMTLDASGNLGVGTTSPVGKLDVRGTAYVDTDYAYFRANNTLQRLRIGTDGVNDIYLPGAAPLTISGEAGLAFTANFSERARITSGGDLLVGTTTAGAGAGFNTRIAVEASSIDSSIFKFTGAAVAGYPVIAWHSATTGDNLLVRFATEGAITTRGNITYNRAGGLVAYNTTSDYRAKDIIGPVQNPGAVIDALKVYEGRMKGATQSRPMLVAHEAQEVTPYAVSGTKDEVNEDGSPKFQQIDVSSLVPLLLAEMQSLRARVAQLER